MIMTHRYGVVPHDFNIIPYWANKDLVLAAVKVNGLELRYAKANLQSDKQVVMVALENDGEALEYIADELKDDPEVLLAALSSMDRKV